MEEILVDASRTPVRTVRTMRRFRLYFASTLLCTIALMGCHRTSPEAHQSGDESDAAHDEDAPSNARSAHQAASPQDGGLSATRGETESTSQQRGSGPHKIQRPNAPPKGEHNAGKGSTPTAGSANTPASNHQAKTAGEANETSIAPTYAFTDTDWELDMILGLRPIPPFRLDDLITIDDLTPLLKTDTPTTITHLPGQPKTPFYNDIWFRSDEDDTLGLVLQYWYFRSTNAAQSYYRMLQRGSLGKTYPIGVGSQAFYSKKGETIALYVLDYDLHAILALTCDVKSCHVPQLMRLYTTARTRIADESSRSTP